MATIKSTLKDPMSSQSEKFEKNFKKTMITTAPNAKLNEVDNMLNEKEQSLKKKIFSLAKMEALVFSDPKLSAVYEEMAENGEEKYGYHYNETIMNMIFNDYVLNSPKYLQKYKMAIPKEKKRRDKSGINQLKKAGEKKMTQSGLPTLKPNEPKKQEVTENDGEPITKVLFLVNERNPEDPDLFAYFPEEIHNGEYRTGYSHVGQHSAVHPDYASESREATPEEYQDLKAELEGVGYNLEVLNGMNETTSAGSAGGAAGYVGYAGPAAWSKKGDLSGDFKGKKKLTDPKAKPISRVISITETNYLTDPSGFEKYIQKLNEEADTEFITKHSQAYGTVNNMSPENRNIIRTDIESGKLNNNSNIRDGIALQEKDNKINPKYSHFAVYKPNSKIINGWEYAGYDPEELKMEKKHYFFDDIVDMDFQPRDINILTAKTLQKRGINPFDINNWFTERYNLDEKSKSKSQQRFMGMVHAVKKGELSPDKVGDKVEKAADSMSMKDTEDFASTKHKGLPEKLDEFLSLHDAVEYVSDRNGENPFELHGQKWQFVNAKYPDGKIDIGVYRFGQDIVYDYQRWQEEMGINENMNEGKEDLIDFDIPEWALPALINADESGLTDEDQQELNTFVNRIVKQYGNANFMLGDIDGEDNLGFKHSNDVDNLGNNVYRLYIRPTKEQNMENNMLQENHLESRDEKISFIKKGFYKLTQDATPNAERDAAQDEFLNSLSDEDIDRIYLDYENRLREIGVDPHEITLNEDFMKIRSEIGNPPKGADFRETNGNMELFYYGDNPEAKAWALNASKKYGIPVHNTKRLSEEFNVEQYVVTVKHDKGTKRIKTGASSEDAAKTNIMKAENCPTSAIIKVEKSGIKEDMQTMIQNNGTSMSNKAQATGDQSGGGVPAGMQATGGLNESDMKLLEEINKELEAFSIHHNKLKVMAENRKTPSMVIGDRIRGENPKNFKKDLQDSGTKEVIDVEKELMWKDQQTDVPNDPQKLGMDIEKQAIKTAKMKGDEALKNVGDSTNDSGDEIPKRNLSTAEQEEVNLYRQGMHSWVYDNEPSKRFEDRMKADMGEEIYDQRQKQIAFKGKAPMYNKDPQPVEDTTAKKVQFDKEQTGWNERQGIKESMITGRYHDALGNRRLIDFTLSEAKILTTPSGTVRQTGLFKLDFTGLGNTYNSKTVDNKVSVNEGVVKAITEHKFYTDGKKIFAIKNPVQSLNEAALKTNPVVNEQVDKMKHLLGYKPNNFVNTANVKKNRGF